MSIEDATKTVRTLFESGWDEITSIAWPDVKFDPPPGETYVRFNMQHNDGFQASMGSPGSNKYRRIGIVTIQIFQPEGQGSLDARQKADIAVGIFKGVEINGITFYKVFAREVGADGRGYYQFNVLAMFRYDDLG